MAVAVAYDAVVDHRCVTADAFVVNGRTVTAVYTSSNCDIGSEADGAHGQFVIIELSMQDADAATIRELPFCGRQRRISTCEIKQCRTLWSVDGAPLAPWESFQMADHAVNDTFDRFHPERYWDVKTGHAIGYQLFLPEGYHADGSYPLILFFHGGGEKGSDNFAPLLASQGGSIWADPAVQTDHPAIILVPQCPEETDWIDPDTYETGWCFDIACRLLLSVMDRYAVDKDRIYCTGLSMGSMAAWEINKRYPRLFAASIMCAGQGDYEGIEHIGHQHLWAFHGENDDKAMTGVVDIMQTFENAGIEVASDLWDGTRRGAAAEILARRQMAKGADIMHTQFKEGTLKESWVHVGGWKPVYSNAAVRAWLFAQRNDNFSTFSSNVHIMSRRRPAMVELGFSGNDLAGISCGARHNLALKKDQTVYSWGFNYSGQLGNGGLGAFSERSEPGPVSRLTGIIQVAAGNNFSLALDSHGHVYGWGCNHCGQLCDPDMRLCFPVPVQLDGLENVVEIGAGDGYGAAVKTDGSLWVWGSGCNGQLGQGDYFRSWRPLQVADPEDLSGFLQNVRHIEIGVRSLFALTGDHRLYGLGDGEYGQLGNGRSGHGPGVVYPQLVCDPSAADGLMHDVIRVASGRCFTIFLKKDGSLYSVGLNRHGEAARSRGDILTVPGKIPDMGPVKQIVAGMNHAAALLTDGTLWTWGYNRLMGEGVLGMPVNDFAPRPVRVTPLPAIAQIYSGLNHMYALACDGSVWTWGNGNNGR